MKHPIDPKVDCVFKAILGAEENCNLPIHFLEEKGYLHRYRLQNDQTKELAKMGGIRVFELPKFHAEHVKTEQERWIKLFKDGKKLDDINLPEWMNTPELTSLKFAGSLCANEFAPVGQYTCLMPAPITPFDFPPP